MKKVFLIACIGFFSISYCQQTSVIIKEPKVADFVKYGNTPIVEYTGNYNLSVPLVDLDLNMFKDNIGLSYNSQGFYPNKRDGELGVNWSLRCGGIITRELNGRPDEYMGSPQTGGAPAHGTYYGGRRMPSSTDLNTLNSSIFNLSGSTIYPMLSDFGSRIKPANITPDKTYEMKSDVFNFNFNGVSGKFYFNAKGEPVVVANNNENIKVDLSHFVEEPFVGSSCGPQGEIPGDSTSPKSKIILIMDNGYRYEFGGNINALSYKTNADNGDGNPDPLTTGINSWYLTAIVNPFGQSLIYEYENFTLGIGSSCTLSNSSSSNSVYGTKPYLLNKYINLDANLNSTNMSFSWLQSGASGSSGSVANDPIYDVTKTCYLRKIYLKDQANNNSDLFRIEFEYLLDTGLLYNSGSESLIPGNVKAKKLSQIKVYSKNAVIKTFAFNYTLITQRKFLTSITLNNDKYYNFDYYFPGSLSLPVPFTKAIDYWGFSNNQPVNQYLVPRCQQNLNGDLTDDGGNIGYYSDDNREPSPGIEKYGMLKRITYPTRGYSEFIYEPHDYSKRLERRSAGNFLPALYNMSGYAGGARIQQIADFDGVSNYNVRQFEYTKNDGSSSGILLDFPRYFYHLQVNGSANHLYKWKSTTYNINSEDGNYITYSQVTETNSDSSKTIRYFSNYETNPDLGSANDIKTLSLTYVTDSDFNPTSSLVGSIPNLYKNFVGVKLANQSNERGKLLTEIKKDALGNTVEESFFTYNNNPNRYNQYIPNLLATGGPWIQSYKIYTYPNYLTQKTTRQYYNGNIVENVTNYTYNNIHNYPVNIASTTSSGEVQEKRLTYPPDDLTPVTAQNQAIRIENGENAKLTEQNRIAQPIKSEDWKNGIKIAETKTSNTYLQSGSYQFNNSNLLPNFFYKAKGNNIPEKALRYKYSDAADFNPTEIDNYETGLTTAYIWGYNKLFLIAKIENATRADIAPYVSNLQYLSDTSTEVSLLAALDALRAALPNAMVTTYTYKPLIGISTITDPKSKRMTYEYDGFGRLKAVKDNEGNIISENEYHYKP